MKHAAKILGALAFAIAANAAAADSQEGRMREALRKAQQTVARLQQEKAALEREKAALAEKLSTLDLLLDKAASLEREKAAARSESATLRAEVKTVRDAADKTRSEKAALQDALLAAQRELRDHQQRSESQRDNLRAALKRESEGVAACEAKNRDFYKLSVELIERYKHKSALDALAQADPLFGIKDVEVENLLQSYREKAGDLQVQTVK